MRCASSAVRRGRAVQPRQAVGVSGLGRVAPAAGLAGFHAGPGNARRPAPRVREGVNLTRTLIIIVVSLAVFYLLICALMFTFQRSLIYFPQPRQGDPPLPLMTLDRDGLSVLVSTHESDRADAVLYFGGNAEDVSRSVDALAAAFPDQALYLMHYRGFGGSAGTPSEVDLVADAQALHDRVLATPHRAVTVVGRSLGTGVAIQLAVSRPVARLVLITPYSSLRELAADLYPWLPVRRLIRDRFESYRHAPQVTVPTRIVVAERDAIVPHQSSDELARHFAPGLVTRVQVGGSDHVSILDAPGFAPAMSEPGERP